MRGCYLCDDEPFFIFSDRTPVQPKQLLEVLRTAIDNIGLDKRLYSVHSFRAGRTTDLAKLNYSITQISRLGRWRSNAVYRYIRGACDDC